MVYRLGSDVPLNVYLRRMGVAMTRKGGGRESGEHVGKPRLSEADASSVKRAPAAANPAACQVEVDEFYGDWCETHERRPRDCERIRELEAAGDDLYAECKKQFDRAERAEARMKELETLIKGMFTTLGELLHARDERSLFAQRE